MWLFKQKLLFFPLMNKALIKLAHDKERALKVLKKWVKKLNQNIDDEKDVSESEKTATT